MRSEESRNIYETSLTVKGQERRRKGLSSKLSTPKRKRSSDKIKSPFINSLSSIANKVARNV